MDSLTVERRILSSAKQNVTSTDIQLQLHAVSRTQQGRQRKFCVKTSFPTFHRVLEALESYYISEY